VTAQAGDCGGRLSTIASRLVIWPAGTYQSTDSWKRVASQIESPALWRSRARPDRQTITQNNRPLWVRLDGGKQMRIPPNQVLFLGQRQWAEFDCPQDPLPDEIRILLWLMDGAERRHRLAIRWSGKEPRGTYPIVSFDDFALEPSNPEICGAQGFWPEAVLSAFERTFEAAT
jgi:hypothetical protein